MRGKLNQDTMFTTDSASLLDPCSCPCQTKRLLRKKNSGKIMKFFYTQTKTHKKRWAAISLIACTRIRMKCDAVRGNDPSLVQSSGVRIDGHKRPYFQWMIQIQVPMNEISSHVTHYFPSVNLWKWVEKKASGRINVDNDDDSLQIYNRIEYDGNCNDTQP